MPRFKRSLGVQGPPLELVPVAKPKFAPLREGFALPGYGPSGPPASESFLSEHRERTDGEALPYRRGSARLAMAAADDPDRCRRVLIAGASADTTKGPDASRRKLWAQLARHCGFEDPFFLSPQLIYTVMGALKQGGYRSASLYLESAQGAHIALGHAWNSQLQQARRAAIRSCKRFLGHAKQAGGLPLVRLAEVTDQEPLAPGGPLWPSRSTILASWWLLREREAAQAKRMHVQVDEIAKTISWRLPSSKTDQAALGAVRSHSCACEIGNRHICPFHLMMKQLQDIHTGPMSPIFPSRTGEPASKLGWSDTFEALAVRLGLPTLHPNGARMFTGHSARVTGARHLAATNVELWRIQLFGRWGSSVFLHYIQDAPNVQMQTLALESSAMLSIQSAKAQLEALVRQVETSRQSVAQVQPEMLTDCQATLEAEQPDEALGSEPWVLNTNPAGKIHRALIWDKEVNPKSWRTRCGWNFAVRSADYTMYDSSLGGPDHATKCRKCFPEFSKGASLGDTSSSDSISASTDDSA